MEVEFKMPLEHGKSKKAFGHNVEAEMHAGKPLKQSLAIAYAVKKRGKKMAHGGMMTDDGYQSECDEHCNHPGEAHPKAEYMEPHEGDHKRPNHMAIEQDDKMLNQHGDDEIGPEGEHMAEGGFIGSHQSMAHDEDMVGRIMKKRQHMYSKGGMVSNDDHPFEYEFETPDQFDDLVLDDHLESKGTDNERGNMYGSDHKDPVATVMMKRKKQHNPRPA